MTNKNTAHGPGLIGYILLEEGTDDDNPRFKRPIKWQDCQDNTHWACGECKNSLPNHSSDCPVHAAYLAYEKAKNEYVRPDWMCKGCDQPEGGPHRFGCAIRGARASQMVLPVTQAPDGSFSVDLPKP